jgi:hypothetical protein
VAAERWWQPTAALDATRIGGQIYSPAEVRATLDVLKNADFRHPMNVASIALVTGVPGRTVRQIISDLDGKVMLVGKRAAGLFVCHYADEADEYSHYLSSHWRSERERAWARNRFASDLPRRALYLFEAEQMQAMQPDDEDED